MSTVPDLALKDIKLADLKEAAAELDLAAYGTKDDIVKRIAKHDRGKSILNTLFKTSQKKTKEVLTLPFASLVKTTAGMGMKREFMAKERARLVDHGVTDKAKMKTELARLWAQFTQKPNATIKKKSAPTRIKEYDNDIDDDALDRACDELEDRAVARLKGKRPERAHVDGILAAYGVDASSYTMAQAKEEMILQIMHETDDEDEDDTDE